jgi:hypothetical protein
MQFVRHYNNYKGSKKWPLFVAVLLVLAIAMVAVTLLVR